MKHLLFNYNLDVFIQGLLNEVSKGTVSKKDKGELSLFSYTPLCQHDRTWNDFSLCARGLILHLPTNSIVALPFPKFFNFGERSYDISNQSFTVSEKLDGSLGIIYYWNNRWNVCTRGSFNSEQSKWAEAWLYENCELELMLKEITYLVEIIYPQNRIVIKYDFEGLVLLTAYSTLNGKEYDNKLLDFHAESVGFYRPKYYEYSFEQLLEVSKALTSDKEGFVVHFDDGVRLKIKGDEYCRVHRIISNVTPLAVWNSMMSCDNLDELRIQLPEEFRSDFDLIVHLLETKFYDLLDDLRYAREKTDNLTDKELGLLLNSPEAKTLFSEQQRRFLFAIRKDGLLYYAYEKGIMREKVFRSFRPDGNKLDGYIPSIGMNRFKTEDLDNDSSK